MTGSAFEMRRALAERRHATRRVMRRHAVREWGPVRQAHELPIPDSRQPVQVWSDRLELALFPVLLIGGLFLIVVLAPGGVR